MEWMDLVRFGAYCAVCTRFCKVASKKKGYYSEVMDDIRKLTGNYEKLEDSIGTGSSSMKNIIDPNVVNTKGAPKKKKFLPKKSRHCSNCGSTKHNARSCEMHVGMNDSPTMNEEPRMNDALGMNGDPSINVEPFMNSYESPLADCSEFSMAVDSSNVKNRKPDAEYKISDFGLAKWLPNNLDDTMCQVSSSKNFGHIEKAWAVIA